MCSSGLRMSPAAASTSAGFSGIVSLAARLAQKAGQTSRCGAILSRPSFL